MKYLDTEGEWQVITAKEVAAIEQTGASSFHLYARPKVLDDYPIERLDMITAADTIRVMESRPGATAVGDRPAEQVFGDMFRKAYTLDRARISFLLHHGDKYTTGMLATVLGKSTAWINVRLRHIRPDRRTVTFPVADEWNRALRTCREAWRKYRKFMMP